MKRIKTKITLIILVTIVLVAGVLGVMSVVFTTSAIESTIAAVLSKPASVAAYDKQGNTIAVSINESEFMAPVVRSAWFILAVSAFICLFGLLIASVIGNSIAKPINQCVERLKLLANGDLASAPPVIKTKDETSALSNETAKLIYSLREIITDISSVLKNISKGNMDIVTTAEYAGDFVPIKNSMDSIAQNLNSVILQIAVTTAHVGQSSNQFNAGSAALATGATEQASAIEELSATISEIAQKIAETADNTVQSGKYSGQAREQLIIGNSKMSDLLNAMEEITETSEEISKIIKTIEDIAFQTNILALNAAVEAARAGEAGKGFAVVADEVRNLANKSAEASKNTSALIERSMTAVGNGTAIANETALALEEVMKRAKKSGSFIAKISADAKEQAKAIEQVNTGVNQVADVVQQNSATAEQSSAMSQELNDQVNILNGLIAKFNLKKENTKFIR